MLSNSSRKSARLLPGWRNANRQRALPAFTGSELWVRWPRLCAAMAMPAQSRGHGARAQYFVNLTARAPKHPRRKTKTHGGGSVGFVAQRAAQVKKGDGLGPA